MSVFRFIAMSIIFLGVMFLLISLLIAVLSDIKELDK
jgi:hypothetical protein